MKNLMKVFFMFSSLVAVSAFADQDIGLNDIDTNYCEAAKNEVMLLNSPSTLVSSVCSPYSKGGYKSVEGDFYDYRLFTTVTVVGTVEKDAKIRLNDIDTNNCVRAKKEIDLLSKPPYKVNTLCSEYLKGGYKADNGKFYDYRLSSWITVE